MNNDNISYHHDNCITLACTYIVNKYVTIVLTTSLSCILFALFILNFYCGNLE